MGHDDKIPKPPAAPRIERRVRIHPLRFAGLVVFLVLPVILAALGVFGETRRHARADGAPVSVDVRWPERFRYRQRDEIQIRVTNRSSVAIDTVTVAIDTTYLSRFSNVTAVPTFDGVYELSLVALAPGELRLAVIELQAEHYGRHRGDLIVIAGDTIRIPLHTTIYP